MINVLWDISPSLWQGGINYFRNLYSAVLHNNETNITIHLLGDSSLLPAPLDNLPSLQSNVVNPRSLAGFVSRCKRKLLGYDARLDRVAKAHGMHVFSHAQPIPFRAQVPVISWIPDFQHVALPHFFTAAEVALRNKSFARYTQYAQGIIVSSADAKKTFDALYPDYAQKAHVLRFTANISPEQNSHKIAQVLARHAITEPFFHVPNQLWAHKNHGVLVDALGILQENSCCPLVICTGSMADYRNPNYPELLRQKVLEKKLKNRIRFLGAIPYEELTILMQESMALINPSRFEGWSTSVEEAKSLGKHILLSDIPVHKEQAPARGDYFPCDDPLLLAELLAKQQKLYDAGAEKEFMAHASQQLGQRMSLYAQQYATIIRAVLENSQQ